MRCRRVGNGFGADKLNTSSGGKSRIADGCTIWFRRWRSQTVIEIARGTGFRAETGRRALMGPATVDIVNGLVGSLLGRRVARCMIRGMMGSEELAGRRR